MLFLTVMKTVLDIVLVITHIVFIGKLGSLTLLEYAKVVGRTSLFHRHVVWFVMPSPQGL